MFRDCVLVRYGLCRNMLRYTPIPKAIRKVPAVQDQRVFTWFYKICSYLVQCYYRKTVEVITPNLVPSQSPTTCNQKGLCACCIEDLPRGRQAPQMKGKSDRGYIPKHADAVSEDWNEIGRSMEHRRVGICIENLRRTGSA